MADNFPLTPGTGRNAATDEVSYSGDTADVQLVRPVLTTGAEGAKTVVALPGDATTGLYTGGNVAHDAADSGNPLKIGHKAVEYAAQTAVAAGDRCDSICDRHSVPFVVGGHPDVICVKHTNITTAVTDTAIITVGAGNKIVVTSFMVTLDNASTVFPSVLLGFAATNTPTSTGVIGAHGGVPAGGGFGRGDGSGIIGIGADGEDLRITTVGNATGNGLQVVVTYYVIPS